MKRVVLVAAAAAAPLSSCFAPGATVQVGYAQMAIEGDLAMSATSGSLTGTIDQDIESAFGLGDPQNSPYVRGQLDLGVPVFTVSGFQFSEDGTGRLVAQFGNLSAGTDVATSLDFANVKASLVFDFEVGPVKVSPGFAVDVFDIEMVVQDTSGFVTEEVDALAPLPMAYLRGEAGLGPLSVVAEVGGILVRDVGDIEGTFWDAEVLVEWRPGPLLDFFVGYKRIHIDGEGEIDDQEFDVDLEISGWIVGGGLRF